MLRKTFIALVGVAIVAIVASTLCTFGWSDGAKILAAMFIAVGVPHIVARKSCSWWSPACSAALTVASLILVASAINYIYCHTLSVNAPLDLPFLEYDPYRDYCWALHHYDGRYPVTLATFYGFPSLMVILWKCFGVSMVWPVAFNIFVSIFSFVLGAAITVQLTQGHTSIKASTAAAIAIILLMLHGGFLAHCYYLRKEALGIFAMSLISFSLVKVSYKKSTVKSLLIFTLGCIVLTLVRANFIYFVIIGILFLVPANWRTQYKTLLALVAISTLAWICGISFSNTFDISRVYDSISGGAAMAQSFGKESGIRTVFFRIIGDYFFMPAWAKILLLPVTCFGEFIAPIPWRYQVADWEHMMPNLVRIWYLTGGIALFYYIFLSWRKKYRLHLIAWWPLASFIIIAYITQGTIHRYFLSFQPITTAIVVYAIATILKNQDLKKVFVKYYAVYLAVIITALLVIAIMTKAFAGWPLFAFGWGNGAKILAAMLIAVGVPHIVAHKCCSWWSPACSAILSVVSLVLVISGINFIYTHTIAVGATLELPYMDSDSKIYYEWALHHYDGRFPLPLTTFYGVPIAMVVLWKIFGLSLIWPVALNVMLTTITIILSGSIAVKLVANRTSFKASTAGAITMALMTFHGYFLSQGYVIQKESFAYISLALISLSFVNINQGKATKSSILYFTIGCLILSVVRARFVNFAAVGVIMLAISHWRTQYKTLIALAAVTVITWYLGILLSSTYDVSRQYDSISGGAAMAQAFKESNIGSRLYSHAMFDRLDYFYQPFYIKILLLPFTMGLQYIIPLPWLNAEEPEWHILLARFREGWYLCGGVAMCYYFVVSWRRKVTLGLIAWWPVICIAFIAYITAGNVGRYNLPFQPMIAAIAVYTLALAHDGVHRKGIRNFFLVYLTLLLGVLFATALFTESL